MLCWFWEGVDGFGVDNKYSRAYDRALEIHHWMADWYQALILVIETNSQNVSDTDFAFYFHRAPRVANSLPYFCCRVWAWPPLASSLSSHVIGIRTSWRVNPSPSSSNSSTPPTVSSLLSLLHRLIHWFVIPSCRSTGHLDYWLLWKWALFCCWLLQTINISDSSKTGWI